MHRPAKETAVSLLLGCLTTVAVAWALGVYRVGPGYGDPIAGVTNRGALEAREGRGWYLQARHWPGARVVFATVAYECDDFWWYHQFDAAVSIPYEPIWDRELVLARLRGCVPEVIARSPDCVDASYMYVRYEFGWP